MTSLLSDYDYALPQELIADFPARERPDSGLFCVDRQSGKFNHRIFRELPDLLKSGDLLVLNDTRVIPARLLGKRATGGETEVLLLQDLGDRKWEALLRPGGKIKRDTELTFGESDQAVSLRVVDDPRADSAMRTIEFKEPDYETRLDNIGHMPLPPYIQRKDTPDDKNRYQTVFARKRGAVAAPTAGLHFDESILARLRERGIEIVYVTLHVSYGTFQPIQVEDVSNYEIFEEEYEVTREAAVKINQAKREGRRVIACGTTSVRTLESAVMDTGELVARSGKTRLFIYPPFQFRIVDGIISNFHLPKSTLLMLISAFLGRERTLAVYREAVEKRYRFYSYGDAMLIL